jgi:hypothetical protein
VKSVHLSLFVLFVVLLAVALGGLSWFSYRNTQQALQAKEESRSALLGLDYREKCRQVNAEFDQELLERARFVIAKLDGQALWVRNQIEPLNVLGLINSNLQHHGHLQLWLWLAESFQLSMIVRLRTPEFHILPDKSERPLLEEDEYYQINTRWRQLARSDNLTFWLPIDEDLPRKANWQGYLDTVTGSDGKSLRRVSMAWLNIGQTRDGLIIPLRLPGTPRKGPGKGPGTGGGRPGILFQYARDTAACDERLAKLKDNHDRDVLVLQDGVANDLAVLRRNLFIIGGGAFVALSCAGFMVMRFGSVPAPGDNR